MRLPICGLLVFVALTAAAPAFGQSADWKQCADVNNRDSFARSLAACNRILKDNREAQNHPMALRNRCGIYYTNDDYEKALADCNLAARREPQSAIVYDRRGLIWRAKGDNDRAIADYDQAIRINPSYARALYHRGTAKHDRAILPAAMPISRAPSKLIRISTNSAIQLRYRSGESDPRRRAAQARASARPVRFSVRIDGEALAFVRHP